VRIAIGGISHETNTYCRAMTSFADFHVLRGERLLGTAGRETDVGGAVGACLARGIEPIPLLHAWAQPSGTIERAAYERLRDELVDRLSGETVDGVCLALHGAGVADGLEDLEADLVAAVRQVAASVPVVATFDLHGNVTQAMADLLDGVFACHQYPHVDLHEQGERAIELIERLAVGGPATRSAVERLPLLLPTTTTFEGPGRLMLARMLDAEREPDVIDVSWFHGFPYTDVAHVGSQVVVTATDPTVARGTARRMAAELWAARDVFRPVSIDAPEAVRLAVQQVAAVGGPVVINETSDNCGGGAPGDGTHLLRALLEAGVRNACFGFIVDAVAARAAHEAGVGASLELQLGGRTDQLHGAPLPVRAYVKALHDGRLILSAMGKGAPLDLGPLARLVVDGLDIVVGSVRSQTFDPGPFVAVGIDVRDYAIVALKSSNHFRAGFAGIARAIVTADPPGLTTHHIEVFPRQRCSEPLWPLDTRATFP
jgi:microcystin degradation protein MlrC